VAVEPVLIVNAVTQQVLQANPAAAELLRIPLRLLVGAPLKDAFDAAGAQAIARSIDCACATGHSEALALRSAPGCADLSARLSLFRADTNNYVLIRLAAASVPAFQRAWAETQTPVFNAIESASTGFLVTDSGLRVEYANQAFLDMIKLPALDQVRGRSLVRWLELTETDLAGLQDQMAQRRASSMVTAGLRSEQGLLLEVEVCAVAVPDAQHSCWGFTIRELPLLS